MDPTHYYEYGENRSFDIIFEVEAAPEPWIVRRPSYTKDLPTPGQNNNISEVSLRSLNTPSPSPILRSKSASLRDTDGNMEDIFVFEGRQSPTPTPSLDSTRSKPSMTKYEHEHFHFTSDIHPRFEEIVSKEVGDEASSSVENHEFYHNTNNPDSNISSDSEYISHIGFDETRVPADIGFSTDADTSESGFVNTTDFDDLDRTDTLSLSIDMDKEQPCTILSTEFKIDKDDLTEDFTNEIHDFADININTDQNVIAGAKHFYPDDLHAETPHGLSDNDKNMSSTTEKDDLTNDFFTYETRNVHDRNSNYYQNEHIVGAKHISPESAHAETPHGLPLSSTSSLSPELLVSDDNSTADSTLIYQHNANDDIRMEDQTCGKTSGNIDLTQEHDTIMSETELSTSNHHNGDSNQFKKPAEITEESFDDDFSNDNLHYLNLKGIELSERLMPEERLASEEKESSMARKKINIDDFDSAILLSETPPSSDEQLKDLDDESRQSGELISVSTVNLETDSEEEDVIGMVTRLPHYTRRSPENRNEIGIKDNFCLSEAEALNYYHYKEDLMRKYPGKWEIINFFDDEQNRYEPENWAEVEYLERVKFGDSNRSDISEESRISVPNLSLGEDTSSLSDSDRLEAKSRPAHEDLERFADTSEYEPSVCSESIEDVRSQPASEDMKESSRTSESEPSICSQSIEDSGSQIAYEDRKESTHISDAGYSVSSESITDLEINTSSKTDSYSEEISNAIKMTKKLNENEEYSEDSNTLQEDEDFSSSLTGTKYIAGVDETQVVRPQEQELIERHKNPMEFDTIMQPAGVKKTTPVLDWVQAYDRHSDSELLGNFTTAELDSVNSSEMISKAPGKGKVLLKYNGLFNRDEEKEESTASNSPLNTDRETLLTPAEISSDDKSSSISTMTTSEEDGGVESISEEEEEVKIDKISVSDENTRRSKNREEIKPIFENDSLKSQEESIEKLDSKMNTSSSDFDEKGRLATLSVSANISDDLHDDLSNKQNHARSNETELEKLQTRYSRVEELLRELGILVKDMQEDLIRLNN